MLPHRTDTFLVFPHGLFQLSKTIWLSGRIASYQRVPQSWVGRPSVWGWSVVGPRPLGRCTPRPDLLVSHHLFIPSVLGFEGQCQRKSASQLAGTGTLLGARWRLGPNWVFPKPFPFEEPPTKFDGRGTLSNHEWHRRSESARQKPAAIHAEPWVGEPPLMSANLAASLST